MARSILILIEVYYVVTSINIRIDLATHALYETGRVTDEDGIDYNFLDRPSFEDFINKHRKIK